MPRLPTVAGDDGNWGTILNEYLSVAHSSTGTLKNQYLNVKDYGATGDGSTDDTAAIQSAIAAATKGAVLFFPAGEYRFTHLTIDKPISLMGSGWWFGHTPVFGSAGWEAPYVTESGGTILRCTATSGIAIHVTASVTFNLQDLFLRGTGDNTMTTTGVQTPGGDAGEYLNGGGTYYVVGCLWQNVGIGNFSIGVRFYTVYQSSFINLKLLGCATGVQCGHKDNHLGMVTSSVINLDSNGCTVVWRADNMGYTTFLGGTFQGYYGTALKLNWSYGNIYTNLYFESVTGDYAIDADDCTNCTFNGGTFSGTGNPIRFRLGANAGVNTYYATGGFNTLLLDGYQNRIVNANTSYITVGATGVWNIIEQAKDISTTSPASSNYAPSMYFPVVVNKRGGLVFENGDPILISANGTKYRVVVANDGTLSTTAIT